MLEKLTKISALGSLFYCTLNTSPLFAQLPNLDGLDSSNWNRKPSRWEMFLNDPVALLLAVIVLLIAFISFVNYRKNNAGNKSGEGK